MNDPYRTSEPARDPRHEAETALIQAKAKLIDQISHGMRLANNLSANGFECATSYQQRVEALRNLHREVIR